MANDDQKRAAAELREAKEALHANQRREIAAGVTHETPEYQRLNGAVLDAEKKVSWWRR